MCAMVKLVGLYIYIPSPWEVHQSDSEVHPVPKGWHLWDQTGAWSGLPSCSDKLPIVVGGQDFEASGPTAANWSFVGEVSIFWPIPTVPQAIFMGKYGNMMEHAFLTFPCGSVWKLNILPIRSNFNRKMKSSAMEFRCFLQDVWRLQLWTWNSAWRGSHFSWNETLGQAWMALQAVLEDSQID